LIKVGIIQKISLTPTDLLHVSGEYTEWNREASIAAVKIMAETMSLSVEEFINLSKKQFVQQLSQSIVKSMIDFTGEKQYDTEQNSFLIDNAIYGKKNRNIEIKIKMNKPIIGLGAPASAWLPEVGKLLDTDVILPDDRDVANAIGAAVGDIHEFAEATIVYDPLIKKIIVYASSERSCFVYLKDAIDYAENFTRAKCSEIAGRQKIIDYEIFTQKDIRYANPVRKNEWELLESKVKSVLVGKPSMR